MAEADLEAIVGAFAAWHKDKHHLQLYLRQQKRGERVALVALNGETVAGYGTLVWASLYEPFRQAGIPEIVDLNVAPEQQGRGIGTTLIRALERSAAGRGLRRVGISVAQIPNYAAANRLYPYLGYVADGLGVSEEDGELHLVRTLTEEPCPGDLFRHGRQVAPKEAP